MKIGIFDSGIGGLTILKKILNNNPNCEYIYYGDTINFPFGNKNLEELKNISTNIIEFLISKNVDIIVIACGTISSNLLDYLRDKYSMPIYDIISGTTDYINNSKYENIGILCTKNTKNSKIFENKINKKVEVISCDKLATLIENNDLDIDTYIKEKMSLLKDKDLIVLGCTHYPLVEKTILKYTDSKVINMADYLNIKALSSKKSSIELYFSKIDKRLLNNVEKILKNYKYIIKNK